MNEIDTVVQVSITAETVTPTRQGFGTPCLLTYHTKFLEQYRTYGSSSDMVSDGFTSADPALQMARAIFSQNPAPVSIVVGRLPAAPAFSQTATVTTAVEGAHIKLSVVVPEAGTLVDPVVTGGVISPVGALTAGTVVSIDYTVQPAANTTTVAVALELLIESIPGVSSAAALAVVTITPATAGKTIELFAPQNLNIEETTAAAGYDTELGLLQVENDDWYFILIDSSSEANVAAVAAWVADQKKLFFVQTQSSAVLANTAGNFAEDLALAENERVVVLHSKLTPEQAAAGWVRLGAPQLPGSITWSLKTIRNVTPSSITSTQRGNLETNSVNSYMRIAGINVTRNGTVASGEFIDIIHGKDALEADIKESVFGLLASNPKVPYTGGGLDLIANAILGALKRFEGDQALLVTGSSSVIMPALSTISQADKAARRLQNVKFTAQLQGAVHTVAITGTVTL